LDEHFTYPTYFGSGICISPAELKEKFKHCTIPEEIKCSEHSKKPLFYYPPGTYISDLVPQKQLKRIKKKKNLPKMWLIHCTPYYPFFHYNPDKPYLEIDSSNFHNLRLLREDQVSNLFSGTLNAAALNRFEMTYSHDFTNLKDAPWAIQCFAEGFSELDIEKSTIDKFSILTWMNLSQALSSIIKPAYPSLYTIMSHGLLKENNELKAVFDLIDKNTENNMSIDNDTPTQSVKRSASHMEGEIAMSEEKVVIENENAKRSKVI